MGLSRSTITVFRLMLFAALIVIIHLATTSLHYPVVDDINDKANHILAFYALALLVDFSYPESGFGPAKILPLLGYGLAIEIIQHFLPNRSASLFDVAADAAGLFAYWLSVPALRLVPWFRSRWGMKSKTSG